ncbi:MAG: hypothetical protein H6618_06580 [Deltaproteobacteria bacterium]|nr:hypothetical protein [Deltaproteobacteria bacterium]
MHREKEGGLATILREKALSGRPGDRSGLHDAEKRLRFRSSGCTKKIALIELQRRPLNLALAPVSVTIKTDVSGYLIWMI